MRYQLANRAAGFTSVELLIVIVVIGILAAVSIVAYNGITNSARDASVLSDAESVAGEVVRYAVKNDGQYGEAVEWYSGGSANANVNFTPSPGNIIDIVANQDDYCIRVYNPDSKQYNTLEAAATKGSSDSACGTVRSRSMLAAGSKCGATSTSGARTRCAAVRPTAAWRWPAAQKT